MTIARREIAQFLTRDSYDPRPLICAAKGFGLIWSAKAASVASVAWFLAHIGRLDAANRYSSWPHSYRQVLYGDPEYQRQIDTADLGRLNWVRVIRSPYRRAVSSYISVVEHEYEDHKLRKVLGKSPAEGPLSFREFIDYLGRIDISNANLHLREQRHPLEDVVKPFVICIDDQGLHPGLARFEELIRIDLPSKDRARLLRTWERLASGHYQREVEVNDDMFEQPFGRGQQRRLWPRYKAFLSSDAMAAIERIYATDFATYSGIPGVRAI